VPANSNHLIFGGPLSPIGWKVGFLERPFEVVTAAMREWFAQRDFRYREREQFGAPIAKQLASLAPLQQPPTRQLVVATSAKWTAYFDNSLLGGDPVSWVGYLHERLECRGVIAEHVPPEEYEFPSTQFELLGPEGEKPLGYIRTISAGIYDSGRWQFLHSGEEQPFEEPSAYGARRIRDRFTRETLLRYLAALGIGADNPSFYRDGILIEELASFEPRTVSIEDFQADHGISR
jgi:hypothetical protein